MPTQNCYLVGELIEGTIIIEDSMNVYNVQNAYFVSQPIGSSATIQSTIHMNSNNATVHYSFTPDVEGLYDIEVLYDYANPLTNETETIRESAFYFAKVTCDEQTDPNFDFTHTYVNNGTTDCSKVKVLITATSPFDEINGQAITSTTTYELLVDRSAVATVTIKKSGDHNSVATKNFYVAVPLSNTLSFTNGFQWLIAHQNEENEQDLLYSYDNGNTWTTKNAHVFDENFLQDYVDKTVKTKDEYGCIKTYTVSLERVPQPLSVAKNNFSYFSKGNPIRFYKKNSNYLGVKSLIDLSDCQIQTKRLNYIEITALLDYKTNYVQFKSNWDIQKIDLYYKDNPIATINAQLLYNGLNSDETIDTNVSLINGNGIYYLYFTPNMQETMKTEIGQSITLFNSQSNALSVTVYGYKTLDDGTLAYIIKDIDGLILQPIVKITRHIKNLGYNVYQVSTQRGSLPISLGDDYYYHVIFKQQGNHNNRMVYKSERFRYKGANEVRDDFVIIEYNNIDNNDMFWNTNNTKYLIQKIISVTTDDETVTEINITDDDVFLDKSEIKTYLKIKFEPTTRSTSLALKYALMQKQVKINGDYYVCENIEEKVLDDNVNLYQITAKMEYSLFKNN